MGGQNNVQTITANTDVKGVGNHCVLKAVYITKVGTGQDWDFKDGGIAQ